MDISVFFKSIIDSDYAPIVICDINHKIVYMNPTAINIYGAFLEEKSILDCHNSDSNTKIKEVVKWFGESSGNNKVYTSYNEKENKDVYMIALRDDNGNLIGYYEKHEYRNPEKNIFYELN